VGGNGPRDPEVFHVSPGGVDADAGISSHIGILQELSEKSWSTSGGGISPSAAPWKISLDISGHSS